MAYSVKLKSTPDDGQLGHRLYVCTGSKEKKREHEPKLFVDGKSVPKARLRMRIETLPKFLREYTHVA
jgi:hypothetical protein